MGEQAILKNRGYECFAITDYLISHIQNEFACPCSPWVRAKKTRGEKRLLLLTSCSSKVKDYNS